MAENLIKQTCKELGLTYKQLGELIGYSESAVKSAAVGSVSEPMSFAISQYFKIQELEAKLRACDSFKQNLKDFLNS
ncbi:XRE family transcriptional regulator [Campylobacter gastrosuis]|uniref:XRE family transcriptional regulator n=1 Tax=Campylobacter gastrosuis TaxID=2974576 RepID=A0ABT7HS80_9BACT|nr:XRE family transcriptional regulator [Campylobacter gastrosuis]MDL0089273.1 XRE family transcriptional regulator [Campylobacter gastrosuis]